PKWMYTGVRSNQRRAAAMRLDRAIRRSCAITAWADEMLSPYFIFCRALFRRGAINKEEFNP
ncbi:MAG: hypothetical protein ACI4O7_00055, partial [Aristaeellaceae bacterium]